VIYLLELLEAFMMRVQNKIALVTGAARGIGQSIAELLAEEGATVIVTDINDAVGHAVAREIGGDAEYRRLDVALESEWDSAFSYIQTKFGALDILINNAGITGLLETSGPHDPENLDMESWHKVHDVNLHGAVLGCKYGIRNMKSSNGASIINVSSRSGIVGIPQAAAYASSKAALRNHTKSVALYCAEKNYPIRCNSLHPAAIETPMWDAMLGEGAQKSESIKNIAAEIPLRRMGEAKDVAYAALYLASEESKYLTGIELNIDGGILAGSAASPAAK
jgi:NAD(P)-dependent dehydrogenase (short-subunit alcohol dehydrogenase family)